MLRFNRLLHRCVLTAALFCSFAVQAEVSPRKYAVEVSAEVQSNPAQIRLVWPADPAATGYTVHRKAPTATSWTQLATLPGNALSYVDQALAVGNAFEYQILKSTSGSYSGSGYIYAGVNAQMIENRGKLVLVVDNTHAEALATELARLQQDLVGDGWTVIRHDVSRTATPPSVKALIKTAYDADPANVKAVFLFGHVPVPYSGNLSPDGHPDHQGAWAADTYYADMNGSWTDSSVNNSSGHKPWTKNVPGDGKFDQSSIPSDLELQVGRVDMFNLTCFANKTPSRSELDLLRNYLSKDHKFRHGLLPVERRGLVCDNFGESGGEAFASSGWRNFAPAFGAANNVEVPYGTFFSTLKSQEYLWAYGTGGGSYYTCNGIGSSDDFALNDIKAVFTMFLGSYFGDWDNESNFMRASLGSSTYTLATAWAGRPHWFFHHMALGETIGASAKLSQNNSSLYRTHYNHGTRQIHTALLGDPTLRLHPVLPPANATANAGETGINITWQPSPDTDIQGYLIYRATAPTGPYTRISGNSFVTATTFNDPAGTASSSYMVRAVKLEKSGSGTYYNPSQGAFTNGDTTAPDEEVPPQALPPKAPSSLVATAATSNSIKLTWLDNSTDEGSFKLFRKTGASGSYSALATLPAGTQTFTDIALNAGTTYFYKVAASNQEGDSAFSNEASASTPAPVVNSPAAAQFLGANTTRGGTWKGVIGTEGYRVFADAQSLPAFAKLSLVGSSQWTWQYITSDTRALQKATDRIASCLYSPTSFEVDLELTDGQAHKVSLYMLDWDSAGRSQRIEVLDYATKQVLHTYSLSGFANGTYLEYSLKGKVKFRFVNTGPYNAVLSGLFIDPLTSTPVQPEEPATVATPVISPKAGTIASTQQISITTATTGATIRYTLNGTTPTVISPVYSAPFTLAASATVKAKAFKTGMIESATASSAFTVELPPAASTKAEFVGVNTTRGGTWKGAVGLEGYKVIANAQAIPSYATMSFAGGSEWIWQYQTSDARALQNHLSSRIASCLYSASTFEVDLNIKDGKTHNVSFYCVDWDGLKRTQKVEVLDYDTRQVIHSYSLSNFSSGAYLTYAVNGRVIVRFTNTGPSNAVLSGLFFDASSI